MTDINITFTYDLADTYLSQKNELKKTAKWTYIGPDKIWVFIDNETNEINYNFVTEADYPTPLDHTKIEIDCAKHPLIATLLNANKYLIDQTELPQLSINLPNGEVYTRAKNPDPYHTYERSELTYKDSIWVTSWKKPWITWEDIYKTRDFYVEQAELDLQNVVTLPDSLKQKLNTYVETLKNLEKDWKDFEPYMCILPDYPL
jgi:hypothetical protein